MAETLGSFVLIGAKTFEISSGAKKSAGIVPNQKKLIVSILAIGSLMISAPRMTEYSRPQGRKIEKLPTKKGASFPVGEIVFISLGYKLDTLAPSTPKVFFPRQRLIPKIIKSELIIRVENRVSRG